MKQRTLSQRHPYVRLLLISLICLLAVLLIQQLLAFDAEASHVQSNLLSNRPTAGITIITPTTGLVTREYGNMESFFTGVTTVEVPKSQTYVDVMLDVAPTMSVTIPFQSSDTSEGTIHPSELVFTPANWDVPQRVTISAVDDNFYTIETIPANNDVETYTLEILPLQSGDPAYNGLDPDDLTVTNEDNEIDSADAFGGHQFSVEDVGQSNEITNIIGIDATDFNPTYLSIIHDAQNGVDTVREFTLCTSFSLDDEHFYMGFFPDPDYPTEAYNSRSVSVNGSRYGVAYRFGDISNGRVEYRMIVDRPMALTPSATVPNLGVETDNATLYESNNVPGFNCNQITAAIDLSLIDNPPVGVADTYSTDDIDVLTVAAPQGVLSNDTETGEATHGRPLRAELITPPANGRLNLMPDGAFTYTPTVKSSGVVTFTYLPRQNKMIATGPVTVSINVSTRIPDTLYAATAETDCYPVHPCLWGTDSIQESLDYVTADGTVIARAVHTITAAITNRATAVNLIGTEGHEIRWNGGAGSLFNSNSAGAFTLKGLNLSCVGVCTSATAISQSAGAINAYANNIVGFANGYAGSGTADLGQNWWGIANGANPNVPTADWDRRLGAPMLAWADGNGTAQLGALQLTGGTGTAVLISHGRTISDSLPFGVGVAGEADQVCSDYYDVFVRDASGNWELTVPIDDNAACNSSALANQVLFFITDMTECTTANNQACWDQITNPIVTSGQNLVAQNVTTAQLGGTPLVAGNVNNNDPTAVTGLQAETMPVNNGWWLIALLVGLLGLGTAVTLLTNQQPTKPIKPTNPKT